MKKSLFLVLMFIRSNAFGDDCVAWFNDSKIELGQNCIIDCASTPVDMSTFTCPSQCDDLCKSKPREKYLFKLTDLYPGLTPQERALASKYPVKMLTAYQLSWKAEKACMSIYGSTETGDESDACRHYIWASYLVNEFDKKMAEDILNAHEQNPNQPQEDKAMDLANNRRGTSVAEDLKRSRTYSDSKIIESFKIDLKKGNLIILRPRSKEEIE